MKGEEPRSDINLKKKLVLYIIIYLFLREENISHRWKDLLQQLQEQRMLLGNVVETLSILRDIELVSQELKELQVSLLFEI